MTHPTTTDPPGYTDSVEHAEIMRRIARGHITAKQATARAAASGVLTTAVELAYVRAELRFRNRCYGQASETIGHLRWAVAAEQARRRMDRGATIAATRDASAAEGTCGECGSTGPHQELATRPDRLECVNGCGSWTRPGVDPRVTWALDHWQRRYRDAAISRGPVEPDPLLLERLEHALAAQTETPNAVQARAAANSFDRQEITTLRALLARRTEERDELRRDNARLVRQVAALRSDNDEIRACADDMIQRGDA